MSAAPLPQAVLFDLDGTLIDSQVDIARAVNVALRAVGLPERSLEEVRGFVGEGSRKLLERALGSRQDLLEPAHAAWAEAYSVGLLDHTVLFPGMGELVAAWHARWPGMGAVHTNKPGTFARRITSALGLPAELRVLGSGDGPPRKPAPDGALQLLQALGVAPGDACYVGDSEIDLATAAAAGIPFIGVAWGFAGEARLRAAGAERVVSDAAALGTLLLGPPIAL